MLKVFVSHKNTDQDLAQDVAARVRQNGLDIYLDSIDPALQESGSDLADYLLVRMNECHQLIAVLSLATVESWWVPWEIGVGSEKRFRMATFARTFVDIPGYLKRWPVLRSMRHVDLYCERSKRADQSVRTAKRGLYSEAAQLSAERTNASTFHRDLRAELARTATY